VITAIPPTAGNQPASKKSKSGAPKPGSKTQKKGQSAIPQDKEADRIPVQEEKQPASNTKKGKGKAKK
jgi:hypothetical protein